MEQFYSFACSHIGSSHQKSGTVLQDASASFDRERYCLIAVSDGHGSANFTRSDRGAQFACQVTAEAVEAFMQDADLRALASPFRRDAVVTQLCKNILLRWSQAVARDCEAHPFTEQEVEKVQEKYRAAYLAGERQEHAYGATLQLALITEDFFLAIRNGDGQCVIVDEKGRFSAPVPENEKCEASFTTSLCDENAIEDFRYYYDNRVPCGVFLGSDGIENSYTGMEELFALYRNICRKAVSGGAEAASGQVAQALAVITERGSGDDVSIAGIFHMPALETLGPVLEADAQRRRLALEQAEQARQRQRALRHIRDLEARQEEARRRCGKLRFFVEQLEDSDILLMVRLAQVQGREKWDQVRDRAKKTLAQLEEEMEKRSRELAAWREKLDSLPTNADGAAPDSPK